MSERNKEEKFKNAKKIGKLNGNKLREKKAIGNFKSMSLERIKSQLVNNYQGDTKDNRNQTKTTEKKQQKRPEKKSKEKNDTLKRTNSA